MRIPDVVADEWIEPVRDGPRPPVQEPNKLDRVEAPTEVHMAVVPYGSKIQQRQEQVNKAGSGQGLDDCAFHRAVPILSLVAF